MSSWLPRLRDFTLERAHPVNGIVEFTGTATAADRVLIEHLAWAQPPRSLDELLELDDGPPVELFRWYLREQPDTSAWSLRVFSICQAARHGDTRQVGRTMDLLRAESSNDYLAVMAATPAWREHVELSMRTLLADSWQWDYTQAASDRLLDNLSAVIADHGGGRQRSSELVCKYLKDLRADHPDLYVLVLQDAVEWAELVEQEVRSQLEGEADMLIADSYQWTDPAYATAELCDGVAAYGRTLLEPPYLAFVAEWNSYRQWAPDWLTQP